MNPDDEHRGLAEFLASFDSITYALVLWLSMFGAATAYLQKISSQQAPLSWVALFIELFTASFIGLVVFFAGEGLKMEGWQTAIAIALAAHLGVRSLFLLRKRLLAGLLDDSSLPPPPSSP